MRAASSNILQPTPRERRSNGVAFWRRAPADFEFWDRQRTNLTSLLQVPGIREWWYSDQNFFSHEFRNEVNRRVAVQHDAAGEPPAAAT
jgi:hypothetical protein